MCQPLFALSLVALIIGTVASCDSPRGDSLPTTTLVQPRRIVLSPSMFMPPSQHVSQLQSALDEVGRVWSYPRIPCTALDISAGAPIPRRLVVMDGLNLVVMRSQRWCHNERCGPLGSFPLRAAAMTTQFPEGAEGSDVREGDIEINAID